MECLFVCFTVPGYIFFYDARPINIMLVKSFKCTEKKYGRIELKRGKERKKVNICVCNVEWYAQICMLNWHGRWFSKWFYMQFDSVRSRMPKRKIRWSDNCQIQIQHFFLSSDILSLCRWGVRISPRTKAFCSVHLRLIIGVNKSIVKKLTWM